MKAESKFSLKDHLFNPTSVGQLATLLHEAWPPFPVDAFRSAVLSAFPALELKQRIAHITSTLHTCLPETYSQALAIILAALPPELDPAKTDDDFGDFILAPLSLFVATYGCSAEHLAVSLDALGEITKRFSAEDAVRYFLNAFPRETLQFLSECARDDHYHVRRLASESTRPLLPWAQRLTIDVRAPLPVLEVLFADRTRYVTRSVANHLNDISKLDPDLVLATLRRWAESGRQDAPEMKYIMRHALRTLVKRGHTEALALIGVDEYPDVEIVELATRTPLVRVGDSFTFSVTVRAGSRADVLIDYIMSFAGDGRGTTSKTFRLKRLELHAGETVTLTKAHAMRLMTTRRLYPGEHRVTLQVNGRAYGVLPFQLVMA